MFRQPTWRVISGHFRTFCGHFSPWPATISRSGGISVDNFEPFWTILDQLWLLFFWHFRQFLNQSKWFCEGNGRNDQNQLVRPKKKGPKRPTLVQNGLILKKKIRMCAKYVQHMQNMWFFWPTEVKISAKYAKYELRIFCVLLLNSVLSQTAPKILARLSKIAVKK